MSAPIDASRAWPAGDVTRVPFWIYQDAEIRAREQQRIFEGPVWNYLCLEAELQQPGQWLTTFLGEMPVVVARDLDGTLHAFENRCAHRGALICIEPRGQASRGGGRLTCVYHNWTYDLQGNLKSVAFQRGVKGKGGMPAAFDVGAHGPRKLRVTTLCGLVFGSSDPAAPAIEEYLGPEVLARIRRVLHKPVVITGKITQALPNNWKLYFENVKDSYHASLLHTFLTTFNLNRLTQPGGLIVSPDGAHHVSYSYMPRETAADTEYSKERLRSDSGYRLQDSQMLEVVDEFGDGIMTQILSVFPGLVLQQVQNTIAVRQILPKGQQLTHLNWTFLGFEDDTPEMKRRRLLQSNMIGPAGYVSLEDGAIGGFVQRAVGTAPGESGIVEMGGTSIESTDTRATEASVRGFWKAYRALMKV
jgi:anthranilate 1,2-dioxygenase large subunit/terephthalate 1,2-dioxygenase oxygenase component alpha subunit